MSVSTPLFVKARQARRCASLLAVLLLLAAPGQAAITEYELKAALLFKISKFVRWPAVAPAASVGNPLRLCILGRDDFGGNIDSLAGQTVQGQAIVIERLPRRDQSASHCQIAFISRSEQERVPAVLKTIANSPVLTMSDIEGFAAQGGMVELATSAGKIAFRINPDASRRAGLEIGAQLLQLATLVGGSPGEAGR